MRWSAFAPRQFLSTPSARRATKAHDLLLTLSDISIHALREEGDGGRGSEHRRQQISIHALREEGDQQNCPHC